MPAVARTNVDRASAVIVSGTNSVLINKTQMAAVGSVLANGAAITSGSTTVFSENRAVARLGDVDSKGAALVSGSIDVCIGS
jgi:uncharacterized Zn-binding protein involved in type VI secretion